MTRKKTAKRPGKKFSITLTQTIIILQFVIISVMAGFMYFYQSANESVDRSLAEESLNQRLMIIQMQECINEVTLPCEIKDVWTGKVLPRE